MIKSSHLKKQAMKRFIDYYTELFTGTTECYAIHREWTVEDKIRKAYLPSNYSGTKEGALKVVSEVVQDIGTSEFTPKAVKAHLMGRHFLGVYAIDKDSTVGFFALDFDKDELEARKEARRQQLIFSQVGIPTYVERSRSGNGYHLWGFLEQRVNAGELRFALEPYIEDTDTYDRMFPNQDGTTETKPYGNLIALPLYGPNVKEKTSVFIEIDPTNYVVSEIDDQKQYLWDIQKISKTKIQELFAERKETFVPNLGGRKRTGDPEGLPGIHKVIHPELGCEWIRWCFENPTEVTEPDWHALACQLAQLEGGREAFHQASKDDPRYDPKATDEKFDHALAANAPHTCKTIRDTLNGPTCKCDERFAEYGIKHPYALAKVPFYVMAEKLSLEEEPKVATEGVIALLDRTKAVYKNPLLFEGIPYGFSELDKYTELRPNDLIVFLARPGKGKTAFMIDLAYRVASTGTPVYVYSMEMDATQFWGRLLARMAGVDGTRIQKGQLNYYEWRRLLRVGKELETNPLPIFVDDTTYDSTDVVNKASDMIAEHGKGVVMVDYIQMATKYPNEASHEKTARVVRQYKILAKGMHVPVFALSQLNREGEDLTEDSDITDSAVAESDQIPRYADVMMFLLGERKPGIVRRTLALHKERHREAGHRFKFDFHQALMRFESEGHWTNRAQTLSTQVTSRNFFA